MASRAYILVNFGSNVKRIRKEKGLSQEVLAIDSGLTQTYISQVEQGKRNLTLLNVAAIAITLGVSVSELVGDIEVTKVVSG